MTAQAFTVVGITSRGIFLQMDSRRVVFLSREAYRGPLTVNIDPRMMMTGITIGAAGYTDSLGNLIFSAESVTICAEPNMIWRPPPILVAIPDQAIFARVREVASDLGQTQSGLIAAIPFLLESAAPQDFPLLPIPVTDLLLLKQALEDGNDTAAVEYAIEMLGRGRGLTPSGDDVLIGLMLILSISAHFPPARLHGMTERIIEAAFERTTRLSASLIECAAAGTADERLWEAVSYLWHGLGTLAECGAALRGWGASSGADALVGMVLGLLICSNSQSRDNH